MQGRVGGRKGKEGGTKTETNDQERRCQMVSNDVWQEMMIGGGRLEVEASGMELKM